ncbi:protein tyrosine phosphatase domain-containing protein 1 [Gadus chalcogrammus]|uniref:protein tyrosine phosphatase domain-containing protein 1 n=1 Tax=Gadus chalcogrammus TaxID=1042646 RepID=UPI0024C48FA6|nr:protein tyrosine phosphatase domain-containing protein 1 [Gadus chalcogrammus]
MPDLNLPTPVPRPSYSQARENLVKAIPPRILCLLVCGGVDCRYEGPACWRANQQAIRGLFSSWVTDDIVAMARPSSHLMEKFNIIEQFHRLNIKSIINMQQPGEHAHCGPPLDPESGFTYSPQSFMENSIFFYNFGMPDFGVSSLVGIIDGVKVLAFAVKEGRVAVHCHAGLGRTGVLIACYLVYILRISPSEAVHYVRIKRPRSIQTRAQIQHVFDFARLLSTQLAQYPDLSCRHGAHFTLQHYLNRQALLLHGPEARTLRHTPKVVYLLCVCLSCLALGVPAPPEVHAELEKRAGLRTLGRAVRETLVSKQYLPLLKEGHRGSWLGSSGSISSWDEPVGFWERKRELLVNKRSYSDSDLTKITVNKLRRNRHKPGTSAARLVAKALANQDPLGETVLQRSALLQEELNSSECGWTLLVTESDPHVLSCMLWSWLEKLKDPVLSAGDVEKITSGANHTNPLAALRMPQRHTISCLLSCVGTVVSLCPHREDAVLQRLLKAVTRQPPEETANHAAVMKVFKESSRETFKSNVVPGLHNDYN